jgi:hypothetical protein
MNVHGSSARVDAGDSGFPLQLFARTAGVLYLIIIAGGVFAELYVRQRFFVANDAAATAANILDNEALYRWGFAAQLVPLLCNMVLAVIFYELLQVVSRRIAAAVVCFSLVGSAIEGAGLLQHYQPLVLLRRGLALGVDRHLLEAQAYMALSLQSIGFSVALTFFGCTCIARGYLIARSGILPRFIGVFLAVEGVCYLVNSFGNFLAPALAARLLAILLIAGLAEVLLCLWLLIRGVNVRRWKEWSTRARTLAT